MLDQEVDRIHRPAESRADDSESQSVGYAQVLASPDHRRDQDL